MPNFEYDPENHIYKLDGNVIPGYSEIAKAEGLVDLSAVDGKILQESADFGKKFHRMTQLWDKKRLDLATLDKQLIPWLETYKRFLKEYKVEIYAEWIEQPIYSTIWKYGTTPDRLGMVNGKLTVAEIKTTTTIHPAVRLQLAAQKIALTEQTGLKITKRMAVQFFQDEYKVHPYDSPKDERIWLSAVILYNFKKENKLCRQ